MGLGLFFRSRSLCCTGIKNNNRCYFRLFCFCTCFWFLLGFYEKHTEQNCAMDCCMDDGIYSFNSSSSSIILSLLCLPYGSCHLSNSFSIPKCSAWPRNSF